MMETAVILAAGRGVRLLPLTDSTPKPLVPVAGRPILHHIMESIYGAAGIKQFIVVIGYGAEQFRTFQPPEDCKVHYVNNPRWNESNSMLSLALGMDYLCGGGYIVEGDCCFDPHLLDGERGQRDLNRWFARPFGAEDDGCCLRTRADGLIHSLTIEARKPAEADGGGTGRKRVLRGRKPTQWKSCGVLHVTPAGASSIDRWLREGVRRRRERDYYDLILGEHLDEIELHATDIGAAPWVEIDTSEDLAHAEQLFAVTA